MIKGLLNRFRRIETVSLAILFLSTIVWSIAAASLHNYNADQSANVWLNTDFSSALLPEAHSFLFKWPIFYLTYLLGGSQTALVFMTVLICLMTILGLVLIVRNLISDPFRRSLCYLILASIFTYTPLQAVSGAQLPVNMAMLTTRNLEYILLITAILLALKSVNLHSKYLFKTMAWFKSGWLIGLLILTLLFASDKLFIYLLIPASLLGFMVAFFVKNFDLKARFLSLLSSSVLAALASIVLLSLIDGILGANGGIVGSQAGSVGSPYAVDITQIFKGLAYSVKSLITIMGADPFFGLGLNHEIATNFWDRLISVGFVGYIVNLMILGLGTLASFRFIKQTFISSKSINDDSFKSALSLTFILLILMSIAAFSFTKHFFLVDSRYLAIASIVLPLIIVMNWQDLPFKNISKTGLNHIFSLLILVIALGSLNIMFSNRISLDAMTSLINRTDKIARIISNDDKTQALLGDYWRVYPVKTALNGSKSARIKNLEVLPLSGCINRHGVLTNSAKLDLENKPFAYILSIEPTSAQEAACLPSQIIEEFGVPSRTELIESDGFKTKEMLLFYDHGLSAGEDLMKYQIAQHKNDLDQARLEFSAFEEQLSSCSTGKNLATVIAHQDDDLLFMSPDVLNDAGYGDCLRTVYVTSGTAGMDENYLKNRQLGAQTANSKILNIDNRWHQQKAVLNGKEILISQPLESKRASLIFMNLPDGGIDGKGYESSDHSSLKKLVSGEIVSIATTNKQDSYNLAELKQSLADILQAIQPASIRTHGTHNIAGQVVDHSDHLAVGQMVEVINRQSVGAEIKHYRGYNISKLPANVSGKILDKKIEIFLTYGLYDGAACYQLFQCDNNSIYGNYLRRQYLEN